MHTDLDLEFEVKRVNNIACVRNTHKNVVRDVVLMSTE